MRLTVTQLFSKIHTSFSPDSIPGLLAWWDASDAATITLGVDNQVTAWRDKSGSDRDLTPSGDPVPTYVENSQNGKAVVNLGAGGGWYLPSFLEGGDYTIIAVMAVSVSVTGSGFPDNVFIYRSSINGAIRIGVAGSYLYAEAICQDLTSMQVLQMQMGATDTSGADTFVYVNGSPLDTFEFETYSDGGLNLRLNAIYSDDSASLAEFLVFDHKLSDAERSSITTHLKQKWGIA
jgi:hypothetical protein